MPLNWNKLAAELLGPDINQDAYIKFMEDIVKSSGAFGIKFDRRMPTPDEKPEEERFSIVVNQLRENADQSLEDITHMIEKRFDIENSGEYINHLVMGAAQGITMIDPDAETWHSKTFAMGTYRHSSWKKNESLVSFCSRSVPFSNEEAVEAAKTALLDRSSMKAKKLQNRLGIEFWPTNNLAEHLLLERKHGQNRLHLFHHVGYLQALLVRAKSLDLPMDCSMEESLKKGVLPPQLLVETLHSIQAIIFPVIDREGNKILRTLIQKRKFDKKCRSYTGYQIFTEVGKDFNYVYWAERLVELHSSLDKKWPRNKFEKWLAREGNEGNAFLLALIALGISIIVGILSLLLTGFQTWIAWMAWKYPVCN